ncbi:MAG: hypothetical protein GX185_06120 [Tissierellia bacterium]|nr:hypothetical protein [Tissierellia bacterium]
MKDKRYFFVGIIEDSKDTIGVIKRMFSIFDYDLCYQNTRGNIRILNKKNLEIFLISIKPEEVELFIDLGLELDFLIINLKNLDQQGEKFLNKQFRRCNYYIINSDEDLDLLSLDQLDGIVITYGFNSKATMTISSHIIEQTMEASLCLQREITSLSAEKIGAFEFKVQMDSGDKDHIYSILAASILGLLLGEKIEDEKVINI